MVTDEADLTEQTRRMLSRPFSQTSRLARHILKQNPDLTMEEALECARAERAAERILEQSDG